MENVIRIENPDKVTVTVSTTMTLYDWRRFLEQLDKSQLSQSYPIQAFRLDIHQLIKDFEKHLKLESPEQSEGKI